MKEIEFKKEAKSLVQLLCSSHYQSHSMGSNLSIEDISIDLYKLLKLYDKLFSQSIREFDGNTRKDVSEKYFKEAIENVKNEIKRLISDLHIPFPIPDETDDEKSPHLVDTDFLKKIESPILEKWFKKYQKIRSEQVYKYRSEDLEKMFFSLIEIGRYKIKLNAFQKVTLDASFEGSYKFKRTFSKVPDACRYLDNILDYISFDAILERVRSDEIKIIKEGKEITDSKILYNQAYSWWQNEKNKGRKIPKG